MVQKVFQGIVDGQQAQVAQAVESALQAGVPARMILDEGMLAAMAEVGRQFEEGECYVPEMLISAHAMKAGLAKLQPSLKQADALAAGAVSPRVTWRCDSIQRSFTHPCKTLLS